jgi:hypothetical protein
MAAWVRMCDSEFQTLTGNTFKKNGYVSFDSVKQLFLLILRTFRPSSSGPQWTQRTYCTSFGRSSGRIRISRVILLFPWPFGLAAYKPTNHTQTPLVDHGRCQKWSPLLRMHFFGSIESCHSRVEVSFRNRANLKPAPLNPCFLWNVSKYF